MRISWAWQEARWQRWEEEVKLLREEMRQTLEYHDFMACQWQGWAKNQVTESLELNDGLAAHCEKQVRLWEDLALGFAKLWGKTFFEKNLDASWPGKYLVFISA